MVSNLLIAAGFILLASSWNVLYKAQRDGHLAQAGPYARIRHPQYVAFVTIMFGFLLQWPTLVTLIMFPILVTMYALLAKREEQDAVAQFGDKYLEYRRHVPAFIPQLFGKRVRGEAPGEKSASG